MPKLLTADRECFFTDYVTIGRSSKCTVCVQDIKLSRVHCEIIRDEQQYILIDLHSQNGTKLNEQAITEAVLTHGDKITLGRADVVFLATAPKKEKSKELPPLKSMPVKKVGLQDIESPNK